VRWWALLLFAGVLGAEDDRFAKDIKNPALQRKINEAIAKGVAYLKSIQRPGGYWSGPEDAKDLLRLGDHTQVGGMTALCLYALGASGVPKDDPAMMRGLGFVFENEKEFEPGASCSTYANALLVLALTRADPISYRTPLHAAADRLVAGQQSDGMWTYILGPVRTGAPARAEDRTAWRKGGWGIFNIPDNSNTQFGVLALWAAQEMADYKVPREAWEEVKKHFLKYQEPDGGWTYRKVNRSSSPTMTAAGVVSLVYALTSLDGKEDALAHAREHRAVKRGLKWLRLGSPKAPWSNYYWTYSLERVGTVLGLDVASWYVPGATWLVEHQVADGSWGGGGGLVMPEPDPRHQNPYETSLALLFLTRATRDLVTTRGGGKVEGPATPQDVKPDDLLGLFDLYVATRPEEREALVPKLAEREAVGLCVAKLRDDRQPVREAAFELLSRLVERPFLFDPVAGFEERAAMLGPIEAFWKEQGERLEWDEDRGRFIAR
jgi:hypothetical protein